MERMMLEISVSDLKESNHFLNDLYQNVTAAIFLADSEARIYNFNDAFRTLFYKQEDQLLKELCGNAMGCVFAEEEGKDCGSTSNCKSCILRECILKSFTDKVPVYKERMTRRFYINDEVIEKHFIFTTKYVTHQGQEMILVIVDDITELEEQRRKIEHHNEALLSILKTRIREYSQLRQQLSSDNVSSDVMRQELQHRMGNSLQLITSLVNLHSRDSKNGYSDRQFMKIIESIQIIKLMYNNIVNETGSAIKVNLHSYLNSIVSSLQGPDGLLFGHIDFRLDVQELQLGIDGALPLGMILYEVLSNAVVPRQEYAEKGTVWIRLKKTGENQCTLSVSDEGQAISTRRFQQSGLGLELVYILCEQIHGRCRIEASGVVQIIFDSSATAEQCA